MTLLRQTSRTRKNVLDGTYKPYKTNDFEIHERGKVRQIKAHKIQDRQLYKSFCTYELKPSTQNKILPSNAASQINKGTQYSIKGFRRGLAKATRKWGNDFYVITVDFHDYFGTIPHSKVSEFIPLSDEASKLLLGEYLDTFPGDKGIGIGGEPSQDISVVYPSKIDRMLSCEPCVIASGRYMDDSYAIVHTKTEAKYVLGKIRKMADSLDLIINESRTKISHMKKDTVIWLKKRTRITSSGKIVMQLTRKNIRDEIRRINYQNKLVDEDKLPRYVADISIECWCAYAKDYNSRRAMKKVIEHYANTFNVSWDDAKILFKKEAYRMDKDVRAEISAIWDKMLEIEKKLSDFTDMLHAQSTNGINENGEAVLDVADVSDENSQAIIDLGDAVDDLSNRVSALES